MKRFIIFSLLMWGVSPAIAQSNPTTASDVMIPVYIAGALVIVLLILVTAVTLYTIRVLNFLTRETQGHAAPAGGQSTGSWWSRMMEKINGAVPLEAEKQIELDHNYDGIRELDNHLPPWWKVLFYGSMVWGAIYLVVYHVTDSLPLSIEEYQNELARADEQIRIYQASQPKVVIDENTLEYTEDAEAIEKGKSIFLTNNCGGCHRNDGGGNSIGPNLTDEYWLHGGDIKDVYRTIRDGVVEKGMPAWGKSMSAQDVKDVTFFVMSLRGTNPPDAKGPQGEPVK